MTQWALSGHDASNLQVASILDQMPVGIGLFDRSGELLHANRHFENVAGGPIPSIRAMNRESWHVISDPETECNEEGWPLHRALNGKLGTPMVDFIRKFECGMERLVGVSAVPLISDDGDVTGALVIVKDVSNRQTKELVSNLDLSNIRRFADYSTNAILIINRETDEIEYMSPTALRLWSGRRQIATAEEWLESVHPDDRLQVIERRRAVANGDSQRFQYRIVDDAGITMRHLREACFSIPGETGAADGIGAIVEDISPELQVYLVQGDGHSVSDLALELATSGTQVKVFSAQDNVVSLAEVLHAGCVVVDLRGSYTNIDLVAGVLQERPDDLQIILVGPADTPAHHVITAMKAGAKDFLLEPLLPGALTRSIEAASAGLPGRKSAPDPKQIEFANRMAGLPRREREVLLGLVGGGTNKSIARHLNISPRTVEVHRAHLMERLNVHSLAELLCVAHDAGYRTA
ncbi:LuxR C-terminal-related transcriptional regulator [Novosphingobium sp. G106]|uniref:LuxR C-terminal-related transcriptional regulator n=1 Tax=Novosphingobium sp. G106 TaxID=2849500 RepID=UPI001C2DCD58|nr:LuxR C-terminal-related transcriptional regulator [Novosphingobium sp. G106]MBV1692273.1 LuxR C-terminal-related transcriptional regulator [Novosphingobium sp. G106]